MRRRRFGRRAHSRIVHRHRRRRAARRYASRALGSKSLFGILGIAIPAIAFVEQLTVKNRASYPVGGTFVQRAQTTVNNVTGNMFGFNLFKGLGIKSDFSQKINPAGIANKYTGIGIASVAGSILMKSMGVRIPMMSKIFGIGKKLLPAGVVGGFFDDPPISSGTNYSTQYYSNPMSNTTGSTYGYVSTI